MTRLLLALALSLAAFAGCVPGSAERDGRRVVGVSLLTLSNPFFKTIGDTITDEAAKHGFRAVVVSGDNDVARQWNQVKDFLARRVSAVVLCPCDSKGIGPAIREANDARVPVFTADLGCLAPNVRVVCHIATDNLEGGRQAGQAMIEALSPRGGKVVIVDFKQAESCLLRVQGFKEALEAYNRDRTTGRIDIVAELPGEGAKDRGFKAAEDALQRFPDLAGIFAINDPSALGAAALEKATKADAVKIVGFDGQADGRQAIRDGKMYADPIQFPDEIGRQTVRAILEYLDGRPPPPEVLIPTRLYRRDDGLKDPELK